MDSYTTSAGSLKVVFTDGAGNPIDPHFAISNIKLTYKYATDLKYGGYKSDKTLVETAPHGFTATGDGKTYQTSSDMTFQIAARYNPILSYTITVPGADGKEVTISEFSNAQNAPVVEVWSKVPSVTVSAISPTGNNPAKITYTTKSLGWRGTEPTFTATGNQTSSIDLENNKATLYAVATADNSTQRHGSFTRPTLTVTIAGIGTNDTVSFTLPAGSASAAVTFSRTGNGIIKQTLGTVSQINKWTSNFVFTHTLDAYYGHGEQTINTITVTRDGVVYTINLEKPIKINNPSSAN
jgi:hypothetical protein